MDKVGRYEFWAEPFHCDFAKRLMVGHLGNHLLNAADFHSHDRGFGMSFLNGINKTWVLSRLAIEMEELPSMYAHFAVETWVENAMRFFTNRNFMVQDTETGKVYGYGRSVWAMIDTVTRQPANLFDVNDGAIKEYIEKEKPCPIAKSSRVNVGEDAKLAHAFVTRYNDIDINGHFNSVKYIEHVLDLFDLEWYGQHSLRRIEIAYVAEAHCGDTIKVYRQDNEGGLETLVRMVKVEKTAGEQNLAASDQAGHEVEICRSLVKFV